MEVKRPPDITDLTNDVAELQLSKSARRIKECNKTLNMTYMKANNPWKPDDFPNHYLPCPKLGLLPPVFVLGVVFDVDQWLDFADQKGIVHYSEHKSRIGTMHLVEIYLSDACGHSLELYTCYSTEDGMFALALVSNYSLRDGENLHEPLAKLKKIFADFGREPKWYLDFGNNAENLEVEDWTMDVEVI